MWGYGLDRSGLDYGQEAGNCDCGNKSSVSIKREKILDYLKADYFLKKDSGPWRNYLRKSVGNLTSTSFFQLTNVIKLLMPSLTPHTEEIILYHQNRFRSTT